ncbi:MAG: hypothetical protein JRN02_07390 [Nitrososphaerota archaeon]|nr:hypothetical protein [Nitrososphaerota archaeon]
MNNSVYLKIEPFDAQKVFETQVENIFKPLTNPTAIFVPAQFGGPLNILSLYMERDVLTFMQVNPSE